MTPENTAPFTPEQYTYIKTHIAHLVWRKTQGLYLSWEDVKDLNAMAMADMVRRWQTYDPAKGAWKTYVGATASWAVANAFRSRGVNRWRLEEYPIDTAAEDYPEQQSQDLYEVIDEIIPDEAGREVCRRRLAGDSLWKIVRETGIGRATVKDALARLHEGLHGRLACRDIYNNDKE